MIVLPHEQGSDEWTESRLGIPTASEFKRIVTATGRLSKMRSEYIADLGMEWWSGEPATAPDKDGEWPGNEWTERGKELEPEARGFYGFETGLEWEKCGLCLTDDEQIGASPDALVGDDGLLELKCPMATTQIGRLMAGVMPIKYYAQVQGQLWVTGRKWADFVSYHPDLPMFRVRVSPEKQYQQALDTHMPKFCAELERGKARLKAMGVEPR